MLDKQSLFKKNCEGMTADHSSGAISLLTYP